MALGCAFIFVCVLMLWRRRARKKRAQRTAMFATAKNLNPRGGWRYRLVRFGEKLFGHKRSHLAPYQYPPPYPAQYPAEHLPMEKLNNETASEREREREMDKILDGYDYSRAGSPHEERRERLVRQPTGAGPTTLEDRSIYSQVTGLPRRAPEPRQPVRNPRDLLPSRFSGTSYTTSTHSAPQDLPPPPIDLLDSSRPPTPAEEYARMVSQGKTTEPKGNYWLQPTSTGGSRNPFRQ